MVGVFQKTPEVSRTVRKATKFVSAEEEAAARKSEIAALKIQRDDSIVNMEIVSKPVDTVTVAVRGKLAAVSVPVDVSSKDASAPQPPVMKRKQSILDSSNPEMLNLLNKMMTMGAENGKNQVPSQSVRPFPIVSKKSLVEPDVPAPDVKEREIKVSKSKLLQVRKL